MAKVAIWGSLGAAIGDKAEVDIDARNVRELLNELERRFPELRPQLKRGVSVSIDGVIHSNGWLATIEPDSEVVLLPRIVGG